MAATCFSVSAAIVSASFWPVAFVSATSFLVFSVILAASSSTVCSASRELGLHLGGGGFLVAGQRQFVGHVALLDRLADFLGNIDVPHQPIEQADVLLLQDSLKRRPRPSWNFWRLSPISSSTAPELRAVVAADALALRNDHLLLHGLEVAETPDDVRRLIGHNAPDGAEVHVDLEAVAGRETDARVGHGLLLAALVEQDLCRSSSLSFSVESSSAL